MTSLPVICIFDIPSYVDQVVLVVERIMLGSDARPHYVPRYAAN